MRLAGIAVFISGALSFLSAQTSGNVPLDDLSFFQAPSGNWKIAGNVTADLDKNESLKLKQGKGVLVNDPGGKHGEDLRTAGEYGDFDLHLEFMMARGSNSGIYLQGLYEIQLFDSWAAAHPRFSDCGGVYERWDEARPEGKKGFEGYAPRINAARAPGLWQTMDISFQAARFDAYGRKTANARLIWVIMNGVVIHENLELTGPTRGAWGEEKPTGPLRLQGDHGPVAFRNIRIDNYNLPPLSLGEMTYAQYFVEGNDQITGPGDLKPVKKGTTAVLTQEVCTENEKFALLFNGPLQIPVAGEYHLDFNFYGRGNVRIDGKTVIEKSWGGRQVDFQLSAGVHQVEIFYVKMESWMPNGLAFYISGPGIRRQPLHAPGSEPIGSLSRQIFIDFEKDPVITRSFVDFNPGDGQKAHRITHAANVGFPNGSCFGYDLSYGTVFQVWRGGFLDATPMWNDRGDGSSRARGSVLHLLDAPAVAVLANENQAWPDTLGQTEGFRPKGYRLNPAGEPTFTFQAYGASFDDQVSPADGRFTRRILVSGQPQGALYARAGKGTTIEPLEKNLFRVDGRYYVRTPEKSAAKPMVRASGGGEELLIPFSGNAVEYELIW